VASASIKGKRARSSAVGESLVLPGRPGYCSALAEIGLNLAEADLLWGLPLARSWCPQMMGGLSLRQTV
jgi:hypothetical protein